MSACDSLYPTAAFLSEYWAEGPRSEDNAEQKELDHLARRCRHPILDRQGTNGYKRRFKCMACRTIWSGPLSTEEETQDWTDDD